ncbi:MAG: ATP-binding protein [Clostridium sp.]
MRLEDEIKNGENKKVEFKEILPNSKNIVKTAIAFSNTAGGKLIIGIKDNREIIGVSDDDIFDLPDRISNIIYDSCYPTIIPEIYVENICGKNVIVIEFYPGNLRPYYEKAKGKKDGTFVRIGATNKRADENMIFELERQRRNISFDEEICYEDSINEEMLQKLLKDFSNLTGKNIERKDLFNIKILKVQNGKEYYTNAGKLLIEERDENSNLIVRAARFKGNSDIEFIDSKNFSGVLYKQIEETINFIKVYIEKYSKIEGIQRQDEYRIPIVAIREALVNAVVHRDYTIEGASVNVKIFDDRIEILSPGGLPRSLDVRDIMLGRSEVRNKIIARFFKEIRYIEQWGTGIRRIIELCREKEIKEPIFAEIGDGFKVTIFKRESDGKKETDGKSDGKKKTDGKTDGKKKTDGKTDVKKDRERVVTEYIKENEYITTKKAMELFGIKESATKSCIKKMIEKGILKVEGRGKATKYKLVD